jgi:hypothetical protein
VSHLTTASGLVKTYEPSESGKQDMQNNNTQPSDPSPWAVLRLLSAAAVQRVFVLSP